MCSGHKYPALSECRTCDSSQAHDHRTMFVRPKLARGIAEHPSEIDGYSMQHPDVDFPNDVKRI